MTYTIATLEVSPATYGEIEKLLRAAGYGHAFSRNGVIDMQGIGLARRGGPDSRSTAAPSPPDTPNHSIERAGEVD